MRIFGTINFVIALSIVLLPSAQTSAQIVHDPTGDIPLGDPSYVDLSQVRVMQSTENIFVDFYPVAAIPHGNQSGITTTTIFELYMDVDNNPVTGARLGDIGYDYKLSVDLNTWNGKSWIDGTVYWGFDSLGNSTHQDAFECPAGYLVPQRWRWEFSLISLKWPQINWVARTYYHDHWSDRVPDSGHATFIIDTSLVPAIDTATSEFIQLVYPSTFQTILDSLDVLHTVDEGARIEDTLCGTDFTAKPQRLMFDPWLNGVAYEGNPIMVGSWDWGNGPPWFVLFHELGHDFTLQTGDRFEKLYPAQGYVSIGGDDWAFGTDYTEAWATMVGLYAVHELFTSPSKYSIAPTVAASLQQTFDQTKVSYHSELLTYEVYPDHSHLYPDLLDGIFLALADSFGYDCIRRWFLVLQPPFSPWSLLDSINVVGDYTGAEITSMTITACAFSVAAKADLQQLFINRWDFPIDNLLYARIQPEINVMINGSTEVRPTLQGFPLEFKILGSYPNPFNPRTTIVFDLPRPSRIRLNIYNVLGQLVQSVDKGEFGAGTHRMIFDGGGLPSGAYIYSLVSSSGVRIGKLTLLK